MGNLGRILPNLIRSSCAQHLGLLFWLPCMPVNITGPMLLLWVDDCVELAVNSMAISQDWYCSLDAHKTNIFDVTVRSELLLKDQPVVTRPPPGTHFQSVHI